MLTRSEPTPSHNVLRLEEGRASCTAALDFHNTSLTAGQSYEDEARRDATPLSCESSHAAIIEPI